MVLLEFDAERDVCRSVQAFAHEDEVWGITPSPMRADTFATVSNRGSPPQQTFHLSWEHYFAEAKPEAQWPAV